MITCFLNSVQCKKITRKCPLYTNDGEDPCPTHVCLHEVEDEDGNPRLCLQTFRLTVKANGNGEKRGVWDLLATFQNSKVTRHNGSAHDMKTQARKKSDFKKAAAVGAGQGSDNLKGG